MTAARSDDGNTLIELLVVILILVIIMAPLTASMISALFSTQQSSQRTTNSADEQLVASFFANDVQSSDEVSVPSTAPCGATGATVLQLHWVDPAPTGAIDKTVGYVMDNGALLRVYCEAGGVSRTTPVVSTLETAPTAMCTTAGVTAACPAGPSKPQRVSVDVVSAGGETTGAKFDTLTIKLSAARRVTA